MQALTAEELGCPLPPEDLADRVMPVKELDLGTTHLWRIHRSIYGPIHNNRRSKGGQPFRFDAPNDEFGVLYASPSFTTCMAETVVRGRFQGGSLPLLLDEEELTQRSICDLGTTLGRPLRLADLTQPHFHLGLDNRVLATEDYRGPNLWSAAIHQSYPDIDGIYFYARYGNEPSVAIFDRAPMVPRGESVPLARFHMLSVFLDNYNIGIAPPADPWNE